MFFLSFSPNIGTMSRKTNKLFAVAWIPVLMLFAVSLSIAVPVLWRGFYYLHIDALGLPSATGWDKDVIRDAFDEMMDYCIKNAPFGTGALKWSEEGMRHFEDVRRLFRLDLTVLVVCVLTLALLLLFSRQVKPYRFSGRAPSFFAGCGVLLGAAVLTVLAATDFDRAFVIFHRIFFPGKTNWIFDAAYDQIILILPQVYFRNCAILAVSVLSVICVLFLYAGKKKR